MSEIDLNKFVTRTDLAFEAIDMYKLKNNSDVIDEEYEVNNIVIKRTVVSEEAEKHAHKKKGVYYSLDTRAIQTHDNDDLVNCEIELSKIIKEVLKLENINEKHKSC